MPPFAWFASYIFLGLSICVGILLYMVMYSKRKRRRKKSADLPPDVNDLINPPSDKGSALDELERRYGKKG